MYSPDQLLKGLRDPSLVVDEFRRQRWRVYNGYQRRVRGRHSPRMTERDWDTLVVLDACRYDVFAEHTDRNGDVDGDLDGDPNGDVDGDLDGDPNGDVDGDLDGDPNGDLDGDPNGDPNGDLAGDLDGDPNGDLDGDLDRHYSAASNTAEWLETLFVGRQFPDTVYVTATPKYVRQDLRECFHDVVPVWQTDWDDDLRTVPPDVMTERVLAAHERFPHKRILAHYVQPHVPFIGKTGRKLPHEVVFAQTVVRQGTDEQNVWEALETGAVDPDTVWRAYVENLELALPHVREVLTSVEGRTVVTADHGNAFGEHGLYGHPPGCHVPELITVPWFVGEHGSRRDIEPGEVRSQAAHYRAVLGDDTVSDRLATLGYAE